MKKIIRLFRNPIKFIKKFWFFKYGIVHSFEPTENLFVISHLGQLGQVDALIKKEKCNRNYLLILYTKKNLTIPNEIFKKVDHNIFIQISFLELPVKPNEINLRKLMYLNNSYKKLILEIKPKKLFVLSFEKHYCLLISSAMENNIKVSLLEEGTATYKYESYSEAIETLKNGLTKKEKRTSIVIKYLPFFKQIRPALTIPLKFDHVYSSFPERLAKVFSIGASHYFFIYESIVNVNDEMKSIYDKYNFKKNDIIFLNQRYPIPVAIYVDRLLDILNSFANDLGGNIFIKLHPKDTDELKNELSKKISDLGYKEKITLIDESDFLVEPLISIVKPKILLSLTSTALVYTKLLSSSTEPLSIYPILKIELLKHMQYTEQSFKEIEDHFHVLNKFKIRTVSKVDDILKYI